MFQKKEVCGQASAGVFPKLRNHPNVQNVQGTYLRCLDALVTKKTPESLEDAHTFASHVSTILNGPELPRSPATELWNGKVWKVKVKKGATMESIDG